jgi:hypothetical protein
VDWENFVSTYYMAVDALRNGDVDEVQIIREWSDHEEETTEGFQMILTRDTIARQEIDRLDETIEKWRNTK